MGSPRVAFCVFCDDVRQEVGGKLSLMGIYGGDMIAPGPPPVILTKLCIVVWIITDIDDPPQRVAVRVLMPPDGSERVKVDLPSPGAVVHQEGAIRLHAQAIVPMAPFPLEHEGFIQVMVETERETLRAGRLMVKFVDTVSGPAPAPATGGAPAPFPTRDRPPSPPAGRPGGRRKPRAADVASDPSSAP